MSTVLAPEDGRQSRPIVRLLGAVCVSVLLGACSTPSDVPPDLRVGDVSQSGELVELATAVASLLPSSEAGAAIVALVGDELEYAFVGNETVGLETGFEFASVTKVMTSALMALLAGEGTVDLTDSAAQYLESGSVESHWRSITVESLLTHSSGLPFLPPNIVPAWVWLTGRAHDPFAGYTTAKLEAAIRRSRPSAAAGWVYSNFGFAVVGLIAERATGRRFADLLERRVLEPVGMRTAGVDRWLLDSVAPPLSRAGTPTSGYTFGAMAPAGAVRGSVVDAGAFLRFAARACADDSSVGQAVCLTTQAAGVSAGSLGDMGLAWVRSERESGTAIWHNGGTGGYATFLGFSPETRRAAAILTNVSGLREIDELGRTFIAGPRR